MSTVTEVKRKIHEARAWELITIEELAAAALCSEQTIRRDIGKGGLRALQPRGEGTRILIRCADAYRYIYGDAQLDRE